MAPRAILLDFYGTVVSDDAAVAIVAEIASEIAAAAATPLDAREVYRHWWERFQRLCHQSYGDRFQLHRELEHRSLQDLLRHWRVEIDIDRAEQRLVEYWRHPDIFPDSLDVLARCTLPVCVVSNVDNEDLRVAMASHGLAFDHVVTSEDCRAYKPRPEIFGRALDLLGCTASEMLHIGDSVTSDVAGAASLGIATV
jgi:2-haloacid dehalogenase/putative hydrolase of the HAD superfamily